MVDHLMKECPKILLQCNSCLLKKFRSDMEQHQQQCDVYDQLVNLREDVKFKEDILQQKDERIKKQQATIEKAKKLL